jgi:hypothetical protein
LAGMALRPEIPFAERPKCIRRIQNIMFTHPPG